MQVHEASTARNYRRCAFVVPVVDVELAQHADEAGWLLVAGHTQTTPSTCTVHDFDGDGVGVGDRDDAGRGDGVRVWAGAGDREGVDEPPAPTCDGPGAGTSTTVVWSGPGFSSTV